MTSPETPKSDANKKGESPGLEGLPAGEVLGDLRIPSVPEGCTPRGVMALIKVEDSDGDPGWCVRVTSDLDDEELLGVLVGYVEHLKQQAAASWDESDVTRVEDE